MAEPLTPAQREAQERIHVLLNELAEAIGPSGWEDEPGTPPGANVLLSEWVIVANWLDASDDAGYLTRFGSANLQTAHRVGLLHEGLYGFDD